MLPDFPEIKARLDAILVQRMKTVQTGESVLFSSLRRTMQHEGTTMLLVRCDGSRETVRFRRSSARFTLGGGEADGISPTRLLAKVDAAANELGTQMTKLFAERFEQAAKEVGNVVDMHGEPLEAEHLFRMWEKVHIDFDRNGTPRLPQVVTGSRESYEHLLEVNEQIAADSGLQERFCSLMRQKWEEFRAREADRKLVG